MTSSTASTACARRRTGSTRASRARARPERPVISLQGRGAAAHHPARAGAPRPRRFRARDASLPAAAFRVLALALDLVRRAGAAPRGERLRRALEELGPIFVKFGQALSTRRDLLPADIADELAKLQDRVPPFPARPRSRASRKRSDGRVTTMFRDFEETPLAAASIAQVHAATPARRRAKSW